MANLRLTAREYALLERKAKERGVTISKLVRDAVLAERNRIKEATNAQRLLSH